MDWCGWLIKGEGLPSTQTPRIPQRTIAKRKLTVVGFEPTVANFKFKELAETFQNTIEDTTQIQPLEWRSW